MSSGRGPESSPRAEPVATSSPASPTHIHRQAKSIDVCSLIHGIHRASSDLSVGAECPTASRADPVQIVANLKLISKSRQSPPGVTVRRGSADPAVCRTAGLPLGSGLEAACRRGGKVRGPCHNDESDRSTFSETSIQVFKDATPYHPQLFPSEFQPSRAITHFVASLKPLC